MLCGLRRAALKRASHFMRSFVLLKRMEKTAYYRKSSCRTLYSPNQDHKITTVEVIFSFFVFQRKREAQTKECWFTVWPGCLVPSRSPWLTSCTSAVSA